MNEYKFQITDTPTLVEKVIPGTEHPNIYGEVVCSKDEIRVREKDGLVSLWIGARLEATTLNDNPH